MDCAEDSDYIKSETVVGSPVYGWSVIGPLGVTPGETSDARKEIVSPGEIACTGYIRPKTVVHLTVYVASMTGSLLSGSYLEAWRGLHFLVILSFGVVESNVDSSGKGLPVVNQVGAAMTATNSLPGTFLGLGLDFGSDKLYDLVGDIPDVMGLRALQHSAAVVKVMSVPNSRCIRIVTPDDNVNIGFHDILIHNLEDEELPFVASSELGCLRLDWPNTLFTFMSRYQFDLDQMWKECRQWFGSTQSGTCATCGKHIQQNLGKHIALYHMELAQLWRCPVTWCTVWKGTAQDCVDHMRRTHDIPPLVKAANLARWFPPWTVTREQWSSKSRPAVSGIAVDTLLFYSYSIQLHWGAVVSPVSGLRSCGETWGFLWHVHAMDAYFSGGIGCGIIAKASSSMRSGYFSTDVADISLGHGGQDARCFFSTQSISSVGLLGPEAYQAGASGSLIGGHGNCSPSSFRGKHY